MLKILLKVKIKDYRIPATERICKNLQRTKISTKTKNSAIWLSGSTKQAQLAGIRHQNSIGHHPGHLLGRTAFPSSVSLEIEGVK